MRKILGLTLGATVLMMGCVEGVGPDKRLAKKGVDAWKSNKQIKPNDSPTGIQGLAEPSPRAGGALNELLQRSRSLRTVLLNLEDVKLSAEDKTVYDEVSNLVKTWCKQLTAATAATELAPEVQELLTQKSADAGRVFEVGARILTLWTTYETDWGKDATVQGPLLALLKRAAGY